MFHTEVQVMDALFAVILTENSMHGECAVLLLEAVNVQAPFNDSPMENYKELLKTILNKLGLHDILRDEILYLNSDCQYNCKSVLDIARNVETNNETNAISQKDEDPSRDSSNNVKQKDDNVFGIDSTNNSQTLPKSVDSSAIQSKSEDEIIDECGKESTKKSEICEKKRKSLKSHKHSKQAKVTKTGSNLNDFQMLNMIRSVNDEFDSNILDFINADDEIATEVEVNNDNLVYSSNSKGKKTETEANENSSELLNKTEINVKSENSCIVLKHPKSEESCTANISQKTKFKQFREKFSFKPRNVNLPVNKIAGSSKNDTINDATGKNAEISSQSLFMSKDEDYDSLNFDF